MHTIIGAKSFHCPVRDGKEWGQLAMVVRHNWYQSPGLVTDPAPDVILEEVKKMCLDCCERYNLQLNLML